MLTDLMRRSNECAMRVRNEEIDMFYDSRELVVESELGRNPRSTLVLN